MKQYVLLLILISSSIFSQNLESEIKTDNNIQGTEKVDAPLAITDEIKFKNETGNAIITITDEGNNAGSILLTSTGSLLTGTKLFNNGGNLFWGNSQLNSNGPIFINELADAKYIDGSLFLGEGAGEKDDGISNFNTAAGKDALLNNISGINNTAFGSSTLSNNKSSNNTAYGFSALFNNTIGTVNVATGSEALFSNTTGNHNTANGNKVLFSNVSGHYNTAIGSSALTNNDIGYSNTANGFRALYNNTSGYKNTAIGIDALFINTVGHENTATGYQSLYSNTNGRLNTAAGYQSLYSNTTGGFNTANGYHALYSNTVSGFNTAIGSAALYYNKTGIYNTAIGYACGPSFDNLSNTTAIGTFAYPTASDQVRIGNTSVTSIGGYAPWSNLSDGRYKSNIREDVNGMDFIMGLRPITYNFNIDLLASKLNEDIAIDKNGNRSRREPSEKVIASRTKKASKRQTGFVAQEVEELANSLGYDFSGIEKPENENSMYSLRYAEFVVPIVKAMQEQQELIINQGELIHELRKEIDELKK